VRSRRDAYLDDPETELKFEEQVSYLGRSVGNASNNAREMKNEPSGLDATPKIGMLESAEREQSGALCR
jgi:hypothetical protein